MRRLNRLSCLALCLLLCACSPLPPAEPPADSLMTSNALVILENRQVTQKTIRTVRYGKAAEYFELRLKNGIETLSEFQPESRVHYGQLSYQHYTAAMNVVVAQLQKDGMGMSHTEKGNFAVYYQPGQEGKNASIIGRKPTPSTDAVRYTGYHVYSIGKQTLTPGDGNIMGNDHWGTLSVHNNNPQDPTVNLEEMEYCYILIAD